MEREHSAVAAPRLVASRCMMFASLHHLWEILDSNNTRWKNTLENGFALSPFLSSFSRTRRTTASHQRRQQTGEKEMPVTQRANIWFTAWRFCAAPWSSAIDWVMNEVESMSRDLQQGWMLINVLEQWAAEVQLSAGCVHFLFSFYLTFSHPCSVYMRLCGKQGKERLWVLTMSLCGWFSS